MAREDLQADEGLIFTCHFLQPFPGCAGEFLPDVAHLGRDFVDALSSDKEGCALNHGLTNGMRPIRLDAFPLGINITRRKDRVAGGIRQTNTGQIDAHVHPVDEISNAVKVAAGRGPELRLSLIEVQVMSFQCKVCVSLDDVSPEGNHGFRGKNSVGQTEGDKLINSTTKGRHCYDILVL